jgi:hypothetical protein
MSRSQSLAILNLAIMTQHSGAVSDLPASREEVSARIFPASGELMDSETKRSVLQELEDVCSDPEFQSSHRNCEFLRYVVSESLQGRGQDLRERTLGVELFGRSDTYDTAADAVVRVRANDVRKRLTRHYEKNSPKTGWQITLPPRSYQAVFTRHLAQRPAPSDKIPTLAPEPTSVPSQDIDPRHLTWRQLLTPTLFALVVCVTMFRWQVLASNPFMSFWSTLLAGKSSIDLVVDSPNASGSIQVSQLQGLSPILSVASLFKVDVHFSDGTGKFSTPNTNADANTLIIHLSQTTAGNGVLVVPGSPATLWLQGKNQADLDREVQDLTDSERFPVDAAEKVQQNARYFLPLDQDMQLATARDLPASAKLPQ